MYSAVHRKEQGCRRRSGILPERDYFVDESLLPDPYPYYEAVREKGPVWQEPNHGAFLVTGYDEIGAVMRDPVGFSSCNAFAGPFPPLPEGPHGDDVGALIEKYRGRLRLQRELHHLRPAGAHGPPVAPDAPS